MNQKLVARNFSILVLGVVSALAAADMTVTYRVKGSASGTYRGHTFVDSATTIDLVMQTSSVQTISPTKQYAEWLVGLQMESDDFHVATTSHGYAASDRTAKTVEIGTLAAGSILQLGSSSFGNLNLANLYPLTSTSVLSLNTGPITGLYGSLQFSSFTSSSFQTILTTPEPGSSVAICLGLGGLALRRRKSRKA